MFLRSAKRKILIVSQHLDELEKHIAETDARLGKGKGGILSVNQIELHPWLQRRDIIEWCQKRDVLVQAWAPLAQANRLGEKVLQDIAKRSGKTEAQVLLRWSLQKVRNTYCLRYTCCIC
jgi:diketogulonate reductase-like aldo/keto reductase